MFKRIFLSENYFILIPISFKLSLKGPIDTGNAPRKNV